MVSQVARRHDVLPSQIYAWRKASREGSLVITDGPAFATVEVARPLPPETKLEQSGVVPMIEIEAGAIAVRISGSADTALVERIMDAALSHRDEEIERLERILDKYIRRQYGRSPEKLPPDQMALGHEDLEAGIAAAKVKAESLGRGKTKTGCLGPHRFAHRNLQVERRRATALSDRCPHQHRPALAHSKLMETDVEGLISVARCERPWRNEYRDRVRDTRPGSLQVHLPKLRQGATEGVSR